MITFDYKSISALSFGEHQRIREITRPYYQDPTELLRRALNHNNYIYLSYSDGVLVAYYMVAWETLTVDNTERPALFLGLGCVDPAFRNQKLVSIMYKKSALDAADWQQKHTDELIIWFTTATPVVWHMMSKIYTVIYPTNRTSHSPKLVAVSHAIRKEFYANSESNSHPYVLKGVATSTRYATGEQTYLSQKSPQDSPAIFDQLGISEANGDRLLVLCTIPDRDILESHRQDIETKYVWQEAKVFV